MGGIALRPICLTTHKSDLGCTIRKEMYRVGSSKKKKINLLNSIKDHINKMWGLDSKSNWINNEKDG